MNDVPVHDEIIETSGVADTELQRFCSRFTKELTDIIKKEGSPFHYIHMVLDTDDKKVCFTQWLWTTFPEKEDIFYHYSSNLPWVEGELALGSAAPLAMHIVTMGYTLGCSLKPPPGLVTSTMLLEQYAVDGFITSGEPLFVCQPSALQELKIYEGLDLYTGPPPLIKMHSLGYIKGQARTLNLMALLVWCYINDVQIREIHPKLWETCRIVYVQPLHTGSKMDEALFNMKFSVRGSIRKQNNVIQTVIMVQALFTHGLSDIMVFIRKWNSQSARSSQFIGKKAMALRLLFESAPKHVLNKILHHVEVFFFVLTCMGMGRVSKINTSLFLLVVCWVYILGLILQCYEFHL